MGVVSENDNVNDNDNDNGDGNINDIGNCNGCCGERWKRAIPQRRNVWRRWLTQTNAL